MQSTTANKPLPLRQSNLHRCNDSTELPIPQPFALVTGAVSTGLLFDRYIDLNCWNYLGVAVGCLICWCLFHHRQQTQIASLMMLLGWSAIAGVWHHGYWNWYPDNDIQQYTQVEPVLVRVRVQLIGEARIIPSNSDEALNPIPRPPQVRVPVQVLEIRDGTQWITTSGHSKLVVHAPDVNISCGDQCEVTGRLVGIDSPRNPSQFDFRHFQRGKRSLTSLHAYYPEAIKVIRTAEHGSGSNWKSLLRTHLDRLLSKHISSDYASFASAILLGNREQLESTRRTRFMLTGTAHLLAISGLHVGILAGLFFFLFRIGWIHRRSALLSTVLFVCVYAWMVDFRAPVSRASILIVLFCVARLMGRGGLSFNLLALAALIVLLRNPTELFHTGTQLSFLAVATIVRGKRWIYANETADPLKQLINRTRSSPVRWLKRRQKEAVIAFKLSSLIWFVALPLVAQRFHLIVPIALVINPIVMIPIAIALYSGIGVWLCGDWAPGIADVFGDVCSSCLRFIESLIIWGESISIGHYWTSGPGNIAVLFFYIGALLFAVFPPTRLSRRWLLTGGLIWSVFAWMLPVWFESDSSNSAQFRLTVVDVGHGGSVLLELPDGQSMLYDAGCLHSESYGVSSISAVLWSRRIQHLDALLISHADVDHFNSAVELVRRFSVGRVYLSSPMQLQESEAVRRLLRELNNLNIDVCLLDRGHRLESGSNELKIEVLNPPREGTGGNDNSDSLVLLLDVFDFRVLLPGDLEGQGLNDVLDSDRGKIDVVMAPHHGSSNSRPEDVIRWACPDHVIISGGRRRVDWKAVETFQKVGSEVWITGRDGAIACQIAPTAIKVSKWIKHERMGSTYYLDRGF